MQIAQWNSPARCISGLHWQSIMAESGLTIFVEGFVVFFQILFYLLRSVLLWLIPTRHKDLTEEIVLITGGGRGIGRALAIEFAKQGARKIVLWGRTAEPMLTVANEVAPYGTECFLYVCDVNKQDEIYQQARKVQKEVGNVTILVNNAGIVTSNTTLIDSKDDDIIKTIQTNMLGYIWTTKAFLPAMMDNNHGHLVTMSSLLAVQAIPGAGAYSASKAANVGFAESLAQEIQSQSRNAVYSTVVLPYVVQTGMFQGISTRFNLIFPTLTPEYVAQKTVNAVRKNQQFLMIPRIMYLTMILKSILPHETWKVVMETTGSLYSMETFVGHNGFPKNTENGETGNMDS
ncbi:short-chain dehydrogenase/reductase 3-like [Ptychodera flava]|uniref:short-chain dehydrogenase/reductase 3-like n=1 Tax=Ptychodera flava TaxID=63121 RepID=UPI00396A45D6